MEMALQDWELITSFVLPLIIAVVNQKSWSSATKAWVMFATSAVVVLGQMFLREELNDWSDPIPVILRVTAMTIAFYVGFFKPSNIAPKVEEATYVTK